MPVSPDRRVFYAIGDVHGEIDLLDALHEAIRAHHAFFHPDAGAVWVHLGDLVDRGPDSRAVVERVMALEAEAASAEDWWVRAIRGNHEQMMLDAQDRVEAHEHWSCNGGEETEASYARAGLDRIDPRHLAWLADLPTLWWFRGAGLVFVHGGVDPAVFPDCKDDVRQWTRSPGFFDPDRWTSPALNGQRVVHGHTPTEDFEPEVTADGRRINVDTGVAWGGPLTAAVLAPGASPVFLQARR